LLGVRFLLLAAVVGACELVTLQATAADAAPAAPVVAAAPAPSSTEAAAPPAAHESLAGLSLLVMGGFGTSTTNVRQLNLAPYGGTFGLDIGYTFRVGLRVSGYYQYSLGRSEQQDVNPLIGRNYAFDADTSSMSGGISLGWDVPVYALVLRYGLGFGITSMKWDFGDTRPVDVRFGGYKSPTTGFHFAPGMALIYEHGLFEGGVGFDYFAQANGVIPSGFLGKLVCGVKL
jgi:hypothetical protein